jgi:DNA-binding NarL/FixJ family response regulator
MSLTLDEAPRAERAVTQQVHVLLVHSQRLVADALELLLNDQPDMVVTGKIDCGPEAAMDAVAYGAEVVIIDFRHDVLAASDVASAIGRSTGGARIIALTRDHADGNALRALEAGASGVISESDGFTTVVNSVRRAALGVTLISPGALADLLRKRRARDELKLRITRREAETLTLLAEGLPTRQIASTLGISYLTVRTHIRNLADKLAAHSKVEVVARAYQLDLIAHRQRPGD